MFKTYNYLLKSNHPSLYNPFPRNLFLKSYFQSLLSLPSKSSLAQLDIDLKLLHIGARAPIMKLINSELPDEWKSATITPIYKKKESAEEVTNYRPILILPRSLLLEQIVTYLSDNKLSCNELVKALISQGA